MKNNEKSSGSIFKLRDDVMLKIAAGEVIDRPFSVVRELLDNAIDAGSTEITLHLEEGGKKRIRVLDNGCGMLKEDLDICYLPHTTSKIKENEDLYKIRTLGFRGEALSSISACSRLEITSKQSTGNAGKIIVHGGNLIESGPSKGNNGTDVDVYNLFYNMPARKKFLKSDSAETMMCKNIFTDRAVSYPEITFRLFINNSLNMFFKPEDIKKRICSSYSKIFSEELLDKIYLDGEGYKITAITVKPDFSQKSRKYIQVFVNKRRIYEYSLIQAVEYAYSDYIPGGSFPSAFIFIDINPELVDFNIHPAKKEIKFLNRNDVHRTLSSGIKSHLNKYNIKPEKLFNSVNHDFDNFIPENNTVSVKKPEIKSDFHKNEYLNMIAKTDTSGLQNIASPQAYSTRYIGSLFNVFLLCEHNENLYIIDQHAAHEKLIFLSLKEKEKTFQELLIPLIFDASDSEAEHLSLRKNELKELGIKIEKTGHKTFEITALFTDYIDINESELIEYLKEINKPFSELENKIISLAACRKAVKEGDILSRETAEMIISGAFQLENARCPHGRPIWHIISKENLYKLVKRT